AAPAQDNSAQDNSALNAADNEAVLRQAHTIELRDKLTDARGLHLRGDSAGAAKLYQDCCELAANIGSGIPLETTNAVLGLTVTRLALAGQAQSQQAFDDANTQITLILKAEQELKVAPDAQEVQVFKQHNDELIAKFKGRVPSPEALSKVPQIMSDKDAASSRIQDGN